jgi:adenosylmethionine-8-amino-7-oxononanoate aminotransferase
LDEVITGVGRTGEWFACTTEGIVPDVLVLGKGISGGYYPMAAVLVRDHMVDAMLRGSGSAPFGHTFSGNPLGAATCLAVLDILEREEVVANVRERGAQLEMGLRELAQRRRYMTDVRGRGLLWGFEFVTDGTTKAPPAARCDAANLFVRECMEQGLIVYPAGIAPLNNATIISPPLIITEDEVPSQGTRIRDEYPWPTRRPVPGLPQRPADQPARWSLGTGPTATAGPRSRPARTPPTTEPACRPSIRR